MLIGDEWNMQVYELYREVFGALVRGAVTHAEAKEMARRVLACAEVVC